MTFGLPQPRMAGSKFFPAMKPVVRRELGIVEKAIEASRGVCPNAFLVERVAEVLKMSAPRPHDVSARAAAFQVIREVARERGIYIEVLMGRSRSRDVAAARQFAMWRIWRTGMSHSDIAHLFDRDRTTVIHAVQKHERVSAEKAG